MNDITVIHRIEDAFAILIRDHIIEVDQPYTSGGGNVGPTPVEIFVAALAACAAYYGRRHLARRGLPYTSLEVGADFEMSRSGPARVTAVHLTVRPPTRLPSTELPGLLAAIDHCTVHNSLRLPPGLTVEVTDIIHAA